MVNSIVSYLYQNAYTYYSHSWTNVGVLKTKMFECVLNSTNYSNYCTKGTSLIVW